MLFYPRSRKRPFHLGNFPLERLPKIDAASPLHESLQPAKKHGSSGPVAQACDRYSKIFLGCAKGEPAPEKAPIPDDLQRRAADVKGVCYFHNADQVGICQLADARRAVVVLLHLPRVPEKDNFARQWVEPARHAVADMRLAEIASTLAGHLRWMGFDASVHVPGHTEHDLTDLAIAAGLALRHGEALLNPFADEDFALAAVITDYELATDRPLHGHALGIKDNPAFWWGMAGARSGREMARRRSRPSHMSDHPMEQVKRVDRPTTMILDDEVPQVPKRAAFFERALRGDLGAKSQRERTRFSFKHPLSRSELDLIRAMVPFQDGEVASKQTRNFADPQANARAIKSLSYALGADLTGICEIPRYAWFSHHADGREVRPYHRYAVVMLIDQGFDTMEAASGDDWISGAQSMRAYLRGAEIAGIMAEVLRLEGVSARSQTNADSDVLHIPLILWAGLGELSRIGELVLNPFVGPRFKSVVMTTDLPLAVDRPIDFGLQTFCENCYKCARECPCDAIPFGDKVMFNGYEIWKPDVERCTRYRLTNSKGSACGRCMKTCPLNKVVDKDGSYLSRIASWLGIHAMFLKPILVPIAARVDDWLGNGRRNLRKKWWFDHEIVDGVVRQAKATNQRDIDPSRQTDPNKQKIAYYHANMMPPPDAADSFTVDRKAALAAKEALETAAEARLRRSRQGRMPDHYRPPDVIGADPSSERTAPDSPYK